MWLNCMWFFTLGLCVVYCVLAGWDLIDSRATIRHEMCPYLTPIDGGGVDK